MEYGVQVITYNCNSFAPNASLILALDADVIALQETRLTEKQAKVLSYQAHAHDSVLLTGPHARKIARGKYYVTDKTFPGVAFLVKTSLSATYAAVPDEMLIWYNKGLFLAIEIFVQDRWLSLCNSYVKHGDDHEPFLLGLDSFLSANHRAPILAHG